MSQKYSYSFRIDDYWSQIILIWTWHPTDHSSIAYRSYSCRFWCAESLIWLRICHSVIAYLQSPTGCQGDITVAMALPVTKGVSIEMDGDGGIKIRSSQKNVQYIFKPVNLQALWWVPNIRCFSLLLCHHIYNVTWYGVSQVLQTICWAPIQWYLKARPWHVICRVAYSYLNPDIENARRHNFFPGSRNHHTWAGCYTAKVPDFLPAEDDWEDNSLIENQIAKHDFKEWVLVGWKLSDRFP